MNENPGIVIIGCGNIGQKRAKTLGNGRLVACADVDVTKAESVAAQHEGAQAFGDWQAALAHPAVDVAIISTLHDSLAQIAGEAIEAGLHVLVEKPAGRYTTEVSPLIEKARRKNVKVRVGFNHRYHRAFRKAREIIEAGTLGELMFIRARYGHGGRPGYDREWRADPALSGGGELIDQGPHLIDLARSFLGDFSQVDGFSNTYYWDMPVDDNGFLLLKTPARQVAFLHVSCTEWKNLFSFEIYGKSGKIDISGLGGSYGVERLSHYHMLPEMGPPETVIWEYPMADDSWSVEFAEFLEDIRLDRTPAAGLDAAVAALEIIEHIYKVS